MAKAKHEAFGTSSFVEVEQRQYLHDAAGRKIGGPYSVAVVEKKPLVAWVEDTDGAEEWLIDMRGRKLGEAFMKDSHRGHKDGPGGIVWIGPKNPEDILLLRVAVLPDGTFVGAFDEISAEPYGDVRWVRKGEQWRLLGADGALKGLQGCTAAYDFGKDGLALVRIGKRFAFVNAEGRRAWRTSYADACDFFEGSAWVRGARGWHLIGTDGRALSTHVYDDVDGADRMEPYVVGKKGSECFLVRRKDGQHVLDDAFDEIRRDIDQKPYGFILRHGSVKEDFDARTGRRQPHDAQTAHWRTLGAMGFGSE